MHEDEQLSKSLCLDTYFIKLSQHDHPFEYINMDSFSQIDINIRICDQKFFCNVFTKSPAKSLPESKVKTNIKILSLDSFLSQRQFSRIPISICDT